MLRVPPTPRPEPDDAGTLSAIESILLVAGGPVAISTLAGVVRAPRTRVYELLQDLQAQMNGGVRLQIHDGNAQFVTAPENVETVQRYLGVARPPVLSRPALETLTVIAYTQPTTRSEIEMTRGVNSDRAVQTLLARGLIEERGQRETLGRPMQYGTSFGFLEYFGLHSLADLPPISGESGGNEPAIDMGFRNPAPHERR